VVILAGYTDKMDTMLKSANPGLASRFTERLEFPDWEPADCAAVVSAKAAHKGNAYTDRFILSLHITHTAHELSWVGVFKGEGV
jgi:hypothetical protein